MIFFHVRYLEQECLQRLKAGECLLRAGGREVKGEGRQPDVMGFLYEIDENVLKMTVVMAAHICGYTKSHFPDSSPDKESTCNAGDSSLIPGSGSSPGEGIDYPLQYSWASLPAQSVKNLPAVRETWVHSLGWEDPLEEGIATHSRILAWRIPMDRGAWWATVHGVSQSQTQSSVYFRYT